LCIIIVGSDPSTIWSSKNLGSHLGFQREGKNSVATQSFIEIAGAEDSME
jgi:hypothetical protein